ncbi:hypothetical protein [Alteromonas sp. W364]|uniref:hypothetical protein n=1 Tax=Alteromonas sp. W364 TaxID=3075610 RepID=UPI002884CECB|nr:hypothetical protein [Alteromonas sp. W364]MDT0627468.1 hypothetical protein [Alteromonas sp. W364]
MIDKKDVIQLATGFQVAASTVMTTDKNKQGISLEADAGFELNIGPSNVQVQAEKEEALFRPEDGLLEVIILEGSKADASLKAGPASVTHDNKAKLGVTFLTFKGEIDMDKNK